MYIPFVRMVELKLKFNNNNNNNNNNIRACTEGIKMCLIYVRSDLKSLLFMLGYLGTDLFRVVEDLI